MFIDHDIAEKSIFSNISAPPSFPLGGASPHWVQVHRYQRQGKYADTLSNKPPGRLLWDYANRVHHVERLKPPLGENFCNIQVCRKGWKNPTHWVGALLWDLDDRCHKSNGAKAPWSNLDENLKFEECFGVEYLILFVCGFQNNLTKSYQSHTGVTSRFRTAPPIVLSS